MDILDEELLAFWKSLFKANVRFIMVGGFATNLHGFARTTADVDLWIDSSLENRKKLRTALETLDLGDMSLIETMEFIPGWSSIRLKSGFELDIMTYMKGFSQDKFEECYQLSPEAIIEGIPVKFLHLNFLIEAKEAAGRPKDLIDLMELRIIRDNK